MTDLLAAMASPALAYLVLFALLAVDALVPVVPTQAVMITAGTLTVYGGLGVPAVVGVGALGMFCGDVLAYALGRTAGHVAGPGHRLGPLRRRFAPTGDAGSRTRRAAARFTRGLRHTGPLVLLLCRFVPGGRMAAGYHAGRTGYPVRRFAAYDGLAALGWAAYGGLVGHLGGTAVTQSAWRLLAVAATAAVVFGTAGWVLALFGGHHDDDAGDPEPAHPAAGPR